MLAQVRERSSRISRRAVLQNRLLWVSVLFLVLPLLAFPEIIFGRQTLYKTDLSWIHFPRHIFAAEEWPAGRVPLWDPYEDTGLPLLAETQVGVLYPLSGLFLSSMSPSLELSLFILIHFSLAALFTLVLARTLGLSWGAATVAGLAFGFGGFLMAQVPNLNIMTGAVWLPLILLGAIQTNRRRSWFVSLAAGLPLALQILTAQPQIVFYTLVTVSGYGLYRIGADFFWGVGQARGSFRYALQTGLLLTTLILSGLLLAAPQLLPTYELQQLSVRSQERGIGFLSENSLPPVQWLNLLLPSAFGNNVTGFAGGDPFQEDFIYIGFIPLVLLFFSPAGLRTARPNQIQADRWFFFLLLLGAVVMAMGRFTPFYELVIQYLPGFALFRIPARWLMVVNLALAVLSGLGLEFLLRRGLSRRSLVILVVGGLFIAAGLLLVWYFRADIRQWGHNLNGSGGKLVEAFLDRGFRVAPVYQAERMLPDRLSVLRAPAFLLLFNLGVWTVLAGLYAWRCFRPGTFAGLIVLALSVDLVLAGGTTINPTRPADWWWQLSGGARFVLDNPDSGRVLPLGVDSETLAASHLGQYFPSVYRVPSAGGHGSSLRIKRYRTFLEEAHPVQAIQVTGVQYLLAPGYMGADVAATYPIVYADEESLVYENKAPLPRAFVVHRAVQAGTPDEALAFFRGLEIDPRQTVILETEDKLPQLQPPAVPSGSNATITSQDPQSLEIRTSPATGGYLVLLDTYYPGWIATVNGRPSPVYRANYIGRAVFVPAGESLVRFEYRPRSFSLGLGLSFAVILLIAVSGILRFSRRFRSR